MRCYSPFREKINMKHILITSLIILAVPLLVGAESCVKYERICNSNKIMEFEYKPEKRCLMVYGQLEDGKCCAGNYGNDPFLKGKWENGTTCLEYAPVSPPSA